MKLLVLGASGRTGQHIVDQALSRGHQVTALVRKPDSITAQDGLTIVKGTPTNAADRDCQIDDVILGDLSQHENPKDHAAPQRLPLPT